MRYAERFRKSPVFARGRKGDALLPRKRNESLAIARMHGACDVRVFGSVAHGDACPDSDIDVLVNVGTDYSP